MRYNRVAESTDEIIQDIIKTIDSVDSLVDSFTLFRGMKPWFTPDINTVFSDRGFMSKSVDPVEAEYFGTLFLMYYPQRGKQIYLAQVSEYDHEEEYMCNIYW